MSLDLWLTMPGASKDRGTGVFVRENGATVELSEAQVREAFPDYEPVRVERDGSDDNTVWDRNITHNVAPMWRKAGCYGALYSSKGHSADGVIAECARALQHMRDNPDEYQALNPANGWGNYEGAMVFLESFIAACTEYPDAIIGSWA